MVFPNGSKHLSLAYITITLKVLLKISKKNKRLIQNLAHLIFLKYMNIISMLLWSLIDLGPSPLIMLVKIIHLCTIYIPSYLNMYNISRKWSTIKEISLVWKKAMSFLSNEKCHYADIENRYSKGTIPYINLVFKVNIVTYLYVFSWHLGFWVLM